jgi:hypothetical protein
VILRRSPVRNSGQFLIQEMREVYYDWYLEIERDEKRA